MSKTDLKKVLKPLIKQCIKETLFEEGILSNIIAEVVHGVKAGETLVEQKKSPNKPRQKFPEQKSSNMEKKRKKILDAIGKDSYNGVNLFEGTKPLNSKGNPGQGAAPSSPLADMDPEDPGVDITSIPGARNWKHLV